MYAKFSGTTRRRSSDTDGITSRPHLRGGSGVSAASGLLGKPGTYQKSPGSWDIRYPLPKTEKSADLARGQILCIKKSNIERERVNVRSQPDFYWGNFPVNFKAQNPGGESFPTFPSSGYAHERPLRQCVPFQVAVSEYVCTIVHPPAVTMVQTVIPILFSGECYMEN